MLAKTSLLLMIEALGLQASEWLAGGASGDLYERFAAVNTLLDGGRGNDDARAQFERLARRVQIGFRHSRLTRNGGSEAYLGTVRSPDSPAVLAAVLRAALGAGSMLLVTRPAGRYDLWWRLPEEGQLAELADQASRRAQVALASAQRSGQLRAASLHDYGESRRA